jgi:WD40 repeat protein
MRWCVGRKRVCTERARCRACPCARTGFPAACDVHKKSVHNVCSGGLFQHENSVRLWDVGTGKELKKLGHSGGVSCVSFSPADPGQLVIGSYKTVKLWSVADGQCLQTLTGHSGFVSCVEWAPDGSQLVSGGQWGEIKLWSPTGECLNTLKGHSRCVNCVKFRTTASELVSGSDDCTVKLWSVADGQCLKTLTGHSGGVSCVSFSPADPGLLVTGSYDKTVKLWSVAAGQCLQTHTGHIKDNKDCTCKFWFDGGFKNANPTCPVQGHNRGVEKVEFSQDGATLVSSQRLSPRTFLWDLSTGAGEQVAFAEAGIGTKAGIGRYIVSEKDDLVFVYDTHVGANGGADGEEKVLTAFFRAPSAIVSVSCAGDKIAVGCHSGAVLALHAAWLTDGGAVVKKVEDE